MTSTKRHARDAHLISALDDATGAPVDWWFAYKLPLDARPPQRTGKKTPLATGLEYLYYDTNSKSLALSPHSLKDARGAVYSTLCQLYASVHKQRSAGLGWIFYNDEIPGKTANDGQKGHTKGVLAFDIATDSALWLLHSTPRFPHPEAPQFPHDEIDYGQTYLCITLRDLATAERIADQMRSQQQPQIYACHAPEGLDPQSPLALLAAGKEDPPVKEPSIVKFTSRAGKAFQSIAKSRTWGKDFWNDLVGPHLEVDLYVETWRRGAVPSNLDSDGKDKVDDTQYVDLSPLGVDYEWHYTKDHAKWAVSAKSEWTCVADINRMVSQEKRGGGTIAFQEAMLWRDLARIDKSVP